jgi:nitrate reductase delta subunit
MIRFKTPGGIARTLRALARLLCYPSADLRGHLEEVRAALHRERALGAARLAELDALIDGILRRSPIDAEADYVRLFDGGRSTSLHLFEHVHGDSRDRGPALIDLAQTYERAGLYLAAGEMPDHLPVVLEYASTQPPADARAFLAEMAHILNRVFSALDRRGSRYASVLAALLELAGDKAKPVAVADDEPLDDSWAEPAAFGGCASRGQARPGEAQPIQFAGFASGKGARA